MNPITPQNLLSSLLKAALPLIKSNGFKSKTIALASTSLSLPSTTTTTTTTTSKGYSINTIHSLFPSPPPSTNRFKVKKSLNREELKSHAFSQFHNLPLEEEEEERLGPSKALFETWLEEGRFRLTEEIKSGRIKNCKEAIKFRIRYNEEVLDYLPAAMELLREPSFTPTIIGGKELLPIYSTPGYLNHVHTLSNEICHSLRDPSQGTDWYLIRLSNSLIYTLAESHLLSSSSSSSSSSYKTSQKRIEETLDLIETLFETQELGKRKLKDGIQFGQFVGRSWMGLGRSLGL